MRVCDWCSGEFAPIRAQRFCSPSCRGKNKWATHGRSPEATRSGNLGRYGLTIKDFDALLTDQGGKCLICETDAPPLGRWHIDHDHRCCPRKGSCGKCVRGLLCGPCNTGLGHFKDDPDLLSAAIRYLERA